MKAQQLKDLIRDLHQDTNQKTQCSFSARVSYAKDNLLTNKNFSSGNSISYTTVSESHAGLNKTENKTKQN